MTIAGFNSDLLSGKVALITGGARGQGRSHALALAAVGADIAICDRLEDMSSVEYPLATEEDMEETVRLVEELGARCVSAQVDVRDLAAQRSFAAATAEQLGGIDIVVANAGIFSYAANSWSLTEEQYDEMLDVNLGGVWRTCSATIPHLIERGPGSTLVLISSSNALRAIPCVGHYNAAKFGLVGLCKTLAIELAGPGVRVNTLHPTGVYSHMTEHESMAPALAATEAFGVDLSNLLDVPMLQPEEISAALVWLVSPLARHVTGISLPVDAGAGN